MAQPAPLREVHRAGRLVVRAAALRAGSRRGAGAIATVGDRIAAIPAIPYRGIQPFRFADHAIFFAREEEARRLASLVAVYRGVLLYGDSGTGKSSLINAGLLPQADELGFAFERVRVQPRAGEELVVERIATGEDADAEYLPSSIAGGDDRGSARVVLSVEAFEERVREACVSRRLLLVFDQFEELLTLFEDPAIEVTQQRLVEMLVRLLREPLPVKLLFAFREDYLGRVKQLLGSVPELVDQALRLGPPTGDALPTIIRGPFQRYPGHFERAFDDALVERLRAALAQRFGAGDLSLSEVQTVCLRLWRAEDPQGVLAARGVQGILEDYLGEALDSFPPDQRGAAVALLAQMVTSAGTRNVISAEDLMQRVREDEDLPRSLLERALERLESESKLVRRERRRDLYLYEITSEFLVPWISRRREELRRQQERVRERRRLTRVFRWVVAACVILSAITIWALGQRQEAQDRADEVTALALIPPSTAQLESRPDVSLLLALAAADVRGRPEPRSAVVSALRAARGSGETVAILHGHQEETTSVAYSPDGKRLATAGVDGTVRLWDSAGRDQIGSAMRGHEDAVNTVAFSPDGEMLASGGSDNTIRLWDVDNQEQVATLKGHTEDVSTIAFSPDGRTLASASSDGTARVWDVDTRKTVASIDDSAFHTVAFAPGRAGRTLALADDEGIVWVWDVGARGSEPEQLGAQRSDSIAFARDGLLACAGETSIELWDVTERSLARTTPVDADGTINRLAVGAGGSTLAFADDHHEIALVDGSDSHRLIGHSAAIAGLDFSPDGKTLASASNDSTVRLWQTRTGARDRFDLGSTVSALAFSPEGDRLAAGLTGGGVRLSTPGREARITLATSSETSVHSVAFSRPGGETVAAVGDDGVVRLWDVSAAPRSVPGPPTVGSSLNSVAFRPGTEILAYAGEDTQIRLWDVSAEEQVGKPLTAHEGTVNAVAFSPDGATLASAGVLTILLWDVRGTPRVVETLRGHRAEVTSLAFSADGKTLASAADDNTVRLWNVARGAELAGSPLRLHTAPVVAVAFSADGVTLASAGEDHVVRLWNVRDGRGEPLLSIDGESTFRSVAFSRDGNTLATGDDANQLQLFDEIVWRDLDSLRGVACELVGQDLDKDEWALYAAGVDFRESGCG